MENERVDRLLRKLRETPPPAAGADFTARVLARLDAPHRGASAHWLPRLTLPAVALAATFVVAASLLLTEGQIPEPAAGRSAAAPAALATPPAIREIREVAPALATGSLRAEHARRMLAQIRSEHVRLESDLRRLRQAGREPVLYVGGDEQVDLIVDLGRVRERPARRARAAAAPAPLASQTF